jgi:hypothetical protein
LSGALRIAAFIGGLTTFSLINRSFNTFQVSASELNTAAQLDGDYNQQNYSFWVGKIQVTAW